MDQDKRRRTRIHVGFTVQLAKNGLSVTAETQNLSMKGILCNSVSDFAVGNLCEVSLVLSKEITVKIEGKVVRSDEFGLAIDFIVMNEESFTHLRKLVQYNSSDADAIDSELTSPAFDA